MLNGFVRPLSNRQGMPTQSFLVAFTSHSIPLSMARNCEYAQQIHETCRLVARSGRDCRRALGFGLPEPQRASGGSRGSVPTSSIICRDLKQRGVGAVLIHPIGFLSDHLEVLYDLDVEACALCGELGLELLRSRTVGAHPRFVKMLGMLVAERIGREPDTARACVGIYGPGPDFCPEDCCPAPRRP